MSPRVITRAVERIARLDVQRGQPRVGKELRPRETVLPIAIASLFLFFMWGLAYGLLDIMNYHVKVAMGVSREKAAILAAGYYTAYIPGTLLIGGPLVKRCGYRVAMAVGLSILAVGNELMSVGAANCSLWGMVAGHFVIGLGVSTLERSANPYAVNCGPERQATLRILVAQAWAGIGTVVAPFLANAFIFNLDTSTVRPATDPLHEGRCLMPDKAASGCGKLGSVITFYRLLGACVGSLALVISILFFRTNWFPEIAVTVPANKATCGWKVWTHPLVSTRFARVWWAFFANFVNLGCQVTFAQFFIEHMKVNACQSDNMAAIWMSVAQTAFVAGRFAAAGLVAFPKVFRPRWVLLCFIAGAVAFVGAGTGISAGAAIAVAVMVMFFEAPSFPMVFESATAGFDEWKASCETLMIVSISGGALQPALMGQLVERVGISPAWWLTAGCFGLVLTYPLAINMIPRFSKALDQAESGIGAGEQVNADEENGLRRASKEGFRARVMEMVTWRRKSASSGTATSESG
ncbi:hypothetical protein PV04_06935 [Phialophora macrospora]|uniref:Major facilitator superfamily (MFS) profile domain-containing protein n=1 Tax=Phialophora macrospora TaxID=1851006 RepID=A0A0D2FI28_9EURO|nr:hypothetical protein PV04_06935 [Phialophora macrospora]